MSRRICALPGLAPVVDLAEARGRRRRTRLAALDEAVAEAMVANRYGLTPREVAAEVAHLRAAGWLPWEIAVALGGLGVAAS